jgi:hypothetical protein
MKNRLIFASKTHQNRHRVLQAMDEIRCEEKSIGTHSVKEIASRAGISVVEANKALTFLGATQPQEAEYSTGFNMFRYHITEYGTLAIYSEKYLTEGREKLKTDLLRWFQIGGISVTAIIGWNSLIVNQKKIEEYRIQTERISRQVARDSAYIARLRQSERRPITSKPVQKQSVSVIDTMNENRRKQHRSP